MLITIVATNRNSRRKNKIELEVDLSGAVGTPTLVFPSPTPPAGDTLSVRFIDMKLCLYIILAIALLAC